MTTLYTYLHGQITAGADETWCSTVLVDMLAFLHEIMAKGGMKIYAPI